MSTGLSCEIREVENNKWFYILENWNAPKMAWDWREYATAYGPFDTSEKAQAHLHSHHANPGGYSEYPYELGYEPDITIKELIAKARR